MIIMAICAIHFCLACGDHSKITEDATRNNDDDNDDDDDTAGGGDRNDAGLIPQYPFVEDENLQNVVIYGEEYFHYNYNQRDTRIVARENGRWSISLPADEKSAEMALWGLDRENVFVVRGGGRPIIQLLKNNGEKWERIGKNTEGGTHLCAMSGSSPENIYITASKYDPYMEMEHYVIYHYNGEKLQLIREGDPRWRLIALESVWVAPTGEMYAVGSNYYYNQMRSEAFIFKYDGNVWQEKSFAKYEGDCTLLTVYGYTKKDIYCGGKCYLEDSAKPIFIHYDGQHYNDIDLPKDEYLYVVKKIHGLAEGKIFAIIGVLVDGYNQYDVVYKYENGEWQNLEAPTWPDRNLVDMWALKKGSNDLVFITMDTEDSLYYYNGNTWKKIPNPLDAFSQVVAFIE